MQAWFELLSDRDKLSTKIWSKLTGINQERVDQRVLKVKNEKLKLEKLMKISTSKKFKSLTSKLILKKIYFSFNLSVPFAK